MKHSEQVDKLFQAYVKFKAECPEVVHDATVSVTTKNGGSYTFSYATLGNIQRTTTPVLVENGLSVMQLVGEGGKVTTILLHESGQYISSPEFGIEPKTDLVDGVREQPTPQEIGSTVTYAKRYQLAGVLDIDAMKDDDGNHGSGNQITDEQLRQPIAKDKKPKGTNPKKTKEEPKVEKDKTSKSKTDLDESQSSSKEEEAPVSEVDDDKFIESVKTKDELIKWWGEKINGEQEEHYRTNYMKKVMEKLKELA